MSKIAIYQGVAPDTAAAVFTAANMTVVDAAAVANTSAATADLRVWLSQDGSAAAAGNKVYDTLTVPANSQLPLPLLVNQAIPGGGVVTLEASAASALTVTISGRDGI